MRSGFVRLPALALLGFGLAVASLAGRHAAAATAEFDAKLALAEENLFAAGGADFDRQLSESLQQSAEALASLKTCMESDIPKASLRGYFEFKAGGGYSLELEPAGVFATCVKGAFSGREVPEPPSRPYVNQFTFGVAE